MKCLGEMIRVGVSEDDLIDFDLVWERKLGTTDISIIEQVTIPTPKSKKVEHDDPDLSIYYFPKAHQGRLP